jgi:formylglycine-generating enzyme
MFCIQRLKYIALFLLLALIIFGCGKEPADLVFDNPNDPLSPNYVGNKNTNTGQSQLPSSITGKDGAPMVLIPAGEFQMGSNDINESTKPVHTVYLDAFYIDQYEVTNMQYRKFIDATGHKAPTYWNDSKFNAYNQPVVGVTWDDANAYTKWGGKRLPTEAEWEKAARGGLVGKKYVWGDEWPPPKGAGNFADESYGKVFKDPVINDYNDGYIYTAPVGSFGPNGYNLYDMVVNVWEWCDDWYDEKYYSKSPKQNPTGPSSGNKKVLRGGSWDYDEMHTICVANRTTPGPPTDYDFGFRCVQDVPK